MNREMRRLQAKEEERLKKQRSKASRPQKRVKKDHDLNFLKRILKYLREVRQELKKVAWPSREELSTYTIVVAVMTTVLTGVIFGMDWVFSQATFNVLNAIT